MSNSKHFFKPHIGKNHNGRLILLATTGCCHSDCHHYSQCTNGKQQDWADCQYPDKDTNNRRILLSDTVPYMVEKFINDTFDGEQRYKTFTCLTNAISMSLGGGKLQRWDREAVGKIWENFICTELCQHFIGCASDKRYTDRNSIETKYSDFGKSNSFDKLLSLIEELRRKGIDISKIMILGAPAFKYIKDCCKRNKFEFYPIKDDYGYWHKFELYSQQIDVLYTWHPSYSRYYDYNEFGTHSKLIPELTKFFIS